MGQFEHYGIQPVGEIGLPKRGNRASFERVENKPKPKTAAAGSPPPPPPKNPPKGPKMKPIKYGKDTNDRLKHMDNKENSYLKKSKKK